MLIPNQFASDWLQKIANSPRDFRERRSGINQRAPGKCLPLRCSRPIVRKAIGKTNCLRLKVGLATSKRRVNGAQ
jgi:hypothetical protein